MHPSPVLPALGYLVPHCQLPTIYLPKMSIFDDPSDCIPVFSEPVERLIFYSQQMTPLITGLPSVSLNLLIFITRCWLFPPYELMPGTLPS